MRSEIRGLMTALRLKMKLGRKLETGVDEKLFPFFVDSAYDFLFERGMSVRNIDCRSNWIPFFFFKVTLFVGFEIKSVNNSNNIDI